MTARTKDRDIATLSQWQLIRRRFARHRVGRVAFDVLLCLYLVALFAEFFAPLHPLTRDLDNIFSVANNGVSPNGTGGLFAFNADTTLINSVFADNVGRDCRISGGTVSAIGLLAESNSGCTPQITTDPQLQALAARGGFTATRALASTSPAIGTGDPAFCLPVDQRGAPRVQDAGCDLGAFEDERVFANGFQGPL